MVVLLSKETLVKDSMGMIHSFGNKVIPMEIKSLKEASDVIRNYIEKNDLGSSCYSGGDVFENGEQIARVSYNGRVWDMDGNLMVDSPLARRNL